MKNYMCVTTLVKEMHAASQASFFGTIHEDGWYFYHDALSQMTAPTTVDWMNREDYYRRWLIP